MGDRKNTMHNAQVVIRSPRQLKALIDILHTSLTMWLAGWLVRWLVVQQPLTAAIRNFTKSMNENNINY